MPDNNVDWLVLGDINMIRKQEDRNKLGANFAKMMFNNAISSLRLNEILLQGRKFIPSLICNPHLCWKSWIGSSPLAKALDMIPSDHTPCIVSISTVITKSKVFRFENYWLLHDQFAGIVSLASYCSTLRWCKMYYSQVSSF